MTRAQAGGVCTQPFMTPSAATTPGAEPTGPSVGRSQIGLGCTHSSHLLSHLCVACSHRVPGQPHLHFAHLREPMNRVPTAPHNSYTPNPEATLSTMACPVDPSSPSPRRVNPFAFARLQRRPSVITHLWPPLPPQLIVAFQARSHGHHGNSVSRR